LFVDVHPVFLWTIVLRADRALCREDFETVRHRISEQWDALPPRGDPVSKDLLAKIQQHLNP